MENKLCLVDEVKIYWYQNSPTVFHCIPLSQDWSSVSVKSSTSTITLVATTAILIGT
jgi:hypothetical protein